MAGRHHGCSECEPGQTPGDGEGQGGLACCSPRGRRESDTTARLNNSSWERHLRGPEIHTYRTCPAHEKETVPQNVLVTGASQIRELSVVLLFKTQDFSWSVRSR